MIKKLQEGLGKRERQIMDAVYRLKKASVNDVLISIHDPPSYSAVRAMINILENKGFLKHSKSGLKYIYYPTIPYKSAMGSAVKKLLETYFNNSVEEALASIIKIHNRNLKDVDFDRIIALIEEARNEGGD